MKKFLQLKKVRYIHGVKLSVNLTLSINQISDNHDV